MTAPAATATAVKQTPEQRARYESAVRASGARSRIDALLAPLTADEAERALRGAAMIKFGPEWRDELKLMAEREK